MRMRHKISGFLRNSNLPVQLLDNKMIIRINPAIKTGKSSREISDQNLGIRCFNLIATKKQATCHRLQLAGRARAMFSSIPPVLSKGNRFVPFARRRDPHLQPGGDRCFGARGEQKTTGCFGKTMTSPRSRSGRSGANIFVMTIRIFVRHGIAACSRYPLLVLV